MLRIANEYRNLYASEVRFFQPNYLYTPPDISQHAKNWQLRQRLSHTSIPPNCLYFPPKENEIYRIIRTLYESTKVSFFQHDTMTLQQIAASVCLKKIINDGLEFTGVVIESYFHDTLILTYMGLADKINDQNNTPLINLLLSENENIIRSEVNCRFLNVLGKILPNNWDSNILNMILRLLKDNNNIAIVKSK